jgi:hypothetical protein
MVKFVLNDSISSAPQMSPNWQMMTWKQFESERPWIKEIDIRNQQLSDYIAGNSDSLYWRETINQRAWIEASKRLQSSGKSQWDPDYIDLIQQESDRLKNDPVFIDSATKIKKYEEKYAERLNHLPTGEEKMDEIRKIVDEKLQATKQTYDKRMIDILRKKNNLHHNIDRAFDQ